MKKLLSNFKAQISFLTKLPVNIVNVEKVAKHSYLFPAVAFVIALIIYLFGYLFFTILPVELATVLTIILLYMVVGLIHLDGLADFFDGLMTYGSRQKKITAMKDTKVGIAGVFAILAIIFILFFTIKELATSTDTSGNFFYIQIPLYSLACALVISEVAAKISLNTCITFGRKLGNGIGAIFIKHSNYKKFMLALLIAFLIPMVVIGIHAVFILTGVICGLLTVLIAEKNFGGINGDVMGAAHEICRVVTLIIMVMVI